MNRPLRPLLFSLSVLLGFAGFAAAYLYEPAVAEARHCDCARFLRIPGCYWCTTNCNCGTMCCFSG